MRATPDLSFVITGWNCRTSVVETLHSALGQRDVRVEVVYVDDGSTDGSVELAEEVPDDRLLVLRRAHEGRAAALNAGFSAARGSIISVLDADDLAMPYRSVMQLRHLSRHPDCDVLGGQLEVVDATGRTDCSGRLRFPTDPAEIDAWLTRGRMAIAHPAMACRRDWFETTGGYDPSVLRAEDFDLVLRGWRPRRYASLSAVLTRYRSPLFPSWRYWRRENAYTRAVFHRWQAAGCAPIEIERSWRFLPEDAVKWSGQLFLSRVKNRARVRGNAGYET